jgi:hypothetical protein
VPHGPEQGDGSRRRGAGLHAVKKDSDVFMHDLAFVELKVTGGPTALRRRYGRA